MWKTFQHVFLFLLTSFYLIFYFHVLINTNFFILALAFGPHPVALSAYSWLCTEGATPARAQGPYVVLQIKSGLAICKANILSTVLTLWPQYYSFGFGDISRGT